MRYYIGRTDSENQNKHRKGCMTEEKIEKVKVAAELLCGLYPILGICIGSCQGGPIKFPPSIFNGKGWNSGVPQQWLEDDSDLRVKRWHVRLLVFVRQQILVISGKSNQNTRLGTV